MRPVGIKGFRSGESGAVHGVPASLTRFIGRESPLRLLHERVAAHRLVTLTGPGGAGKRRR